MEVYPWLRLVVVVGRALFQQKLGSFYFSNASTSSSFSFHVLILQQSYVLSLYRGIPHSSNKRSCAISGRWRFSHAISLSLSLSISFVHFFFSLFFRESSFDAISIMHGAVGTVGGKGPPYLREALRTLLPWTLHYFLLRSHTFDQWPDRSSLGLGSAHAYKLVHCFFFFCLLVFFVLFCFFRFFRIVGNKRTDGFAISTCTKSRALFRQEHKREKRSKGEAREKANSSNKKRTIGTRTISWCIMSLSGVYIYPFTRCNREEEKYSHRLQAPFDATLCGMRCAARTRVPRINEANEGERYQKGKESSSLYNLLYIGSQSLARTHFSHCVLYESLANSLKYVDDN